MTINVVNLGSSVAPDFESNIDATAYANASWTPPSADDCIIILWVYNTKATTLGVAGTVTGNGLTWTPQATVGIDPGAQTHRLTLYAAISTGTATAGQTTVDFAGVTQSSIIMQFQQKTGVDLTGGLAGAIIQEPTNSSSSASSLAVALSAASNAANRFIAAVGHGQAEGASAESGWDELDDISGSSPGHALMSMWDSDSVADTSPTVSWATAGAAVGIAAEIVAKLGTTYEESVSLAVVETASFSETIVAIPTRGSASETEFNASPVSPTSFETSGADQTDSGASESETTEFESSETDSTDLEQSNVETEDL